MLPHINWKQKFCKHPSTNEEHGFEQDRAFAGESYEQIHKQCDKCDECDWCGIHSEGIDIVFADQCLLMTVCCEAKICIDCLCAIAKVQYENQSKVANDVSSLREKMHS